MLSDIIERDVKIIKIRTGTRWYWAKFVPAKQNT